MVDRTHGYCERVVPFHWYSIGDALNIFPAWFHPALSGSAFTYHLHRTCSRFSDRPGRWVEKENGEDCLDPSCADFFEIFKVEIPQAEAVDVLRHVLQLLLLDRRPDAYCASASSPFDVTKGCSCTD